MQTQHQEDSALELEAVNAHMNRFQDMIRNQRQTSKLLMMTEWNSAQITKKEQQKQIKSGKIYIHLQCKLVEHLVRHPAAPPRVEAKVPKPMRINSKETQALLNSLMLKAKVPKMSGEEATAPGGEGPTANNEKDVFGEMTETIHTALMIGQTST